jgi:hypothetical protein
MAPPPKYLITRRLIDRYMKSFVPARVDLSKVMEIELLQCYKAYGFDSEKCNQLILKLEGQMEAANPKSQSQINLKLSTEIKKELNKPLYPSEKKGRFRNMAPRPYNFYDGIY